MISDDAKVMLLLNTRIVLDKIGDDDPFTLSQWNELARKIAASSYKRPGRLLNETAQSIRETLSISGEDSLRIVNLIGHSRRLGFELERLNSLGIWIITRSDPDYPVKYKNRLKDRAPSVLFGCGEKALLEQDGIAIVGSRNITEREQAFAEEIGNIAAYLGLIVFSGGARGVDITAMKNAVDGRGCSLGVLAGSLEVAIKKPEYRNALLRGDLALISPYGSNSGFTVGTAMGRNKLIYCLAEYAVVVSSDLNKGGTWAGANEVLKNDWLPLFVRQHPGMPEGNAELIHMGGLPLPDPIPVPAPDFKIWLDLQKNAWKNKSQNQKKPVQNSLF